MSELEDYESEMENNFRTIKHPDFKCFRQRSAQKRLLSKFYMVIHTFLGVVFLYGYFFGYLPKYHEVRSNEIDQGMQGELDFDVRAEAHASLLSEEANRRIFVTVFSVLTIWAYIMAAFSNPGHVDYNLLQRYDSKLMNQKYVEMFKNGKGKNDIWESSEMEKYNEAKAKYKELTERLIQDQSEPHHCEQEADDSSSDEDNLDLTNSDARGMKKDYRELDANHALLRFLDRKLGYSKCQKCQVYFNLDEYIKENPTVQKEGGCLDNEVINDCGNCEPNEGGQPITDSRLSVPGDKDFESKILKPQRAHHCMFCDRCVLEMDHHCYLLGNCVGLMNRKYFFQYGLYMWIMFSFVIVQYIGFWIHYKKSKGNDKFQQLWPMVYSFIVSLGGWYMSSTVILWNMIRGHIISGYTKIERKYRFTHKQYNRPSPFNRGICENFMHVCGASRCCCLDWFLPLPTKFYDGNYEQLLFRWELGFFKDQPHFLGVTFNLLNEDFYNYACDVIKDFEPEVNRKYVKKYKKNLQGQLKNEIKDLMSGVSSGKRFTSEAETKDSGLDINKLEKQVHSEQN